MSTFLQLIRFPGFHFRHQTAISAALLWITAWLCSEMTAFPQNESGPARGYVQSLSIGADAAHVAWTHESSLNTVPVGLSNVCLADGAVYVGDDLGTLRAFRSSDGKLLWAHDHGERIYAAPVSDGTRVFVSTNRGVEAFSCVDGKSLWQKPIVGGKMALWPPRDPGTNKLQMLYVGGSDGFMYGLIAQNGVQRWRGSLMENVPADPEGFDGERARFSDTLARPRGVVTDGQTVFQGIFDQSRVLAINASTGDTLWSFATKGWVGPAPTVDGNDVLIGSQDHKLYCVRADTGALNWEFQTGSRVCAAAVMRGDRVFASSCDGGFYCLDRNTGQVIWKYTDPDHPRRPIYCDPIVTDDSVYFAVGPGQVYAVDTENGKLRWRIQPLSNSELYSDLVTDGTRLFITSRPAGRGIGTSALIAIGPEN